MKLKKISVDEITVGNRIREDMGDLEALSRSIKEYGIINPIVVTEEYELIDGERRLKATKKCNMEKIPAIVRESYAKESMVENFEEKEKMKLMEIGANLHDKNLNFSEMIETKDELSQLKPWGKTDCQIKAKVDREFIEEDLFGEDVKETDSSISTDEEEDPTEKLFKKCMEIASNQETSVVDEKTLSDLNLYVEGHEVDKDKLHSYLYNTHTKLGKIFNELYASYYFGI